MAVISIPNWYQIDFVITNNARDCLLSVLGLINLLKKKKIITKWFFLYEGKTLRIRLKSSSKNSLKQEIDIFIKEGKLVVSEDLIFSHYEENSDSFDGQDSVETFANIMAELTELTVKRIDDDKTFQPYKLMERLSHCIFNNIYGSPIEPYIKLRLMGLSFGDLDNPNQTAIDIEQKYKTLEAQSINIPEILVPVK